MHYNDGWMSGWVGRWNVDLDCDWRGNSNTANCPRHQAREKLIAQSASRLNEA